MSINETFLDDTIDDDEIEIPGFLLFRNDLSRNGGGSAIYVCESLSPCLIKQIPHTNHVEAQTVKVLFGNTPFLITCCYRQPSYDLTSYTKLENIMEDILNLNCNSVFLGDFNINYKASDFTRAHHLEHQLQLSQLITGDTRVTASSNTSIDLIFTNVPHLHSYSDVAPLALSDHYAVYTILNLKISNNFTPYFIRSRNFNTFNQVSFLDDLASSAVFASIYLITDVTEAWNIWENEYNRICNKHAPFRKIRIKKRSNLWFSQSILKAVYKRDLLHKHAVKSQCPLLMKEYQIIMLQRPLIELTGLLLLANYKYKEVWQIMGETKNFVTF